jgi:beta-lactamase class A
MCAATQRALSEEWRAHAKDTDGTVGAAAVYLSSGKLVSLNGDERFPLASVCKLPIAMHLFASIDEGKLRLGQPIEVEAQDVWAGVSDVEKRWPAERRFPLGELIELMGRSSFANPHAALDRHPKGNDIIPHAVKGTAAGRNGGRA